MFHPYNYLRRVFGVSDETTGTIAPMALSKRLTPLPRIKKRFIILTPLPTGRHRTLFCHYRSSAPC